MFDTLPLEARDDKLALLYKLNTENYVAVNTAVGSIATNSGYAGRKMGTSSMLYNYGQNRKRLCGQGKTLELIYRPGYSFSHGGRPPGHGTVWSRNS